MKLTFTEDTALRDARFAGLRRLAETQAVTGLTSSAPSAPADLPETVYGIRLMSRLRLYSRSRYVP